MPILTPEERIGTRLQGKYDVLRICGSGGMGTVYEAIHVWTGRHVAVKILHPSTSLGEAHVARFLREARMAAAIRHPNVVDVLDMGADGGIPFLVLELLRGESLEALLTREERLAPRRCLELLLPIMEGVAAMHDAGIVHRDLKPANVILSEDANGSVVPKLCDFGIAKPTEGEGLTQGDQVMGTPSYMSPEHVLGKQVDPASDVWSMGVVLYRCLSGQLPFPGSTPAQVLSSVLERRPPSLVELDASLPPRLCAAIERALSRDPARRDEDMRTFAAALVATAGNLGPGNLEPGNLEPGNLELGARGAASALHDPDAAARTSVPTQAGPAANVPIDAAADTVGVAVSTHPTLLKVRRRGLGLLAGALAAGALGLVVLRAPGSSSVAAAARPPSPAAHSASVSERVAYSPPTVRLSTGPAMPVAYSPPATPPATPVASATPRLTARPTSVRAHSSGSGVPSSPPANSEREALPSGLPKIRTQW